MMIIMLSHKIISLKLSPVLSTGEKNVDKLLRAPQCHVRKGTVLTSCGVPSRLACNQTLPGAYPWYTRKETTYEHTVHAPRMLPSSPKTGWVHEMVSRQRGQHSTESLYIIPVYRGDRRASPEGPRSRRGNRSYRTSVRGVECFMGDQR